MRAIPEDAVISWRHYPIAIIAPIGAVVPPTPRIGLRRWIWRAFVRSALIPLVLVEAGLIAVYLLSNQAVRDAQINYLRETALHDLQASAGQEARVVDEQLRHVGALTDFYRDMTEQTLAEAAVVAPVPLALTEDGVRYTPEDKGGAAVFYSNVTAPEQQDLDKVARLTKLDSFMQGLQKANPLVASVYFNSHDSLNHIYPWFLTPDQYPHDMVIPDYNFYYLADATHNPERKVVWTDVYLDPAGHGWMMSAIAPVYRGDFLEGVAGLDVTVGGILDHIGELQVPWNGYAVLVSDDMTIMALPSRGEDDFGLNELTTHSYEEAIRRETLKPEDFNLARREATKQLAQAISDAPDGVQTVFLGGRSQLVAWTTIEQTGWRLLTVVDEEAVFEKTNELASEYRTLGYWLIVGLVVFYLVFFGFMWRRARQLSQRLLTPIAGISRMMTEIGAGRWRPQPTDSRIRELDEMASHTAAIGEQLERSEGDRERAQSRLQLVLESATESIWERSEDRTIQVRGRFSKRFGMPTTMQEAAFVDRVHPDDRAAIQTALERVAAGAQDYSVEFRFADANGRYVWLLSRGKVLERDPGTGMVRVMAGTHVDIDALKRVEADLRASSLQAQAASEAKTRFISSMSHELRTPLNAILGFAQLMKLERDESEAASNDIEYLDEILLASQHLSHLVEDILDWSNVQADGRQQALKPLQVRDLLQECADMVGAEVRQRHLRLNLDLPDESLQVAADRRRLRQVILNLLSNAMKYNKEGGDVTLTYQVAASHVRLIVEDTGIGIPADKQAQVFEPFQRLGRENTAILGTGIGLALCKEFAAHQNGVMGLHSEEGIGSSFWIELPLLDATLALPVAAPTKPVVTRAPHVNTRVLYVEDNPASQFLVRKALEPIAEVAVEQNGRAALDRILASPPELLLLDLNLPGLSGEELLKQLRQHSQTRDVPVVVLSAAVYDDAERLTGLDYQALMLKPIDVDELRQLVADILNEGKPHAS